MDIKFNLDDKCKKLKIVVSKNILDEEVSEVISKLSSSKIQKLMCYIEKTVYPIETKEVYRIYTNDGKVFVKTKNQEYIVKERLYQL